jgi:hypothetical protein
VDTEAKTAHIVSIGFILLSMLKLSIYHSLFIKLLLIWILDTITATVGGAGGMASIFGYFFKRPQWVVATGVLTFSVSTVTSLSTTVHEDSKHKCKQIKHFTAEKERSGTHIA